MNTRITGLVVGTLIAAAVARGQVEVEWSRIIGGAASEQCYSLIQTTDGGFAMAGGTESSNNTDFWLVRTNVQGNPLWSHTYGGRSYEQCNSLIQTSDGGFAMAGSTNSFGNGATDYWLVRTNGEGDSLWSRTFGGENHEFCHSLIQTSDGGFAMAGSTNSFGNGEQDFWLIRTNGEGDSLWSRTFGGENIIGNCSSLIKTTDRGFALAGSTGYDYNQNFTIIRTSERGVMLWSNSFGGGEYDYSRSLIQTMDGGFAMAGETNSFGAGSNDIWIIRTDADGDSIWSITLGGDGNEYAFSLIQSINGGFVLTGTTNSFGVNYTDFWLVRISEEGDSLWSQTFDGRGMETECALVQCTDGGFALAGSTMSYGSYNHDAMLVKTTPDPVSVKDPSHSIPSTLLLAPAYPNPFNSTTTIPYTLPRPGWTSMDVMDLNGRLVGRLCDRWRAAGSYREVWDAAGVPTGEYMIRLKAGGEWQVESVQVVR